MTSKKIRNYSILGYVILLSLALFYVKDILEHSEVKKLEDNKEIVEEIKPVDVHLSLDGKLYTAKLSNDDTVGDLLDKLRDNDEIFFEKTLYTYGFEIENLNDQAIPNDYHWRVFLNEVDITNQIGDINLIDDTTYTLELVKK